MNRTYKIIVVITCIFSVVYVAVTQKADAMISSSNSVMFYNCCDTRGSLNMNWYAPFRVPDPPEFKSKTRARLHSAGYTVFPILLARGMSIGYRLSEQSGSSLLVITSGILLGPSAGSLYADDWNLARRSIIIRSVSAVSIASGYYLRENASPEGLGLAMQITSGLFLAGHALYDIFFLSAHSVEYYNMRIRVEAGLSMNNSMPIEWTRMPSQNDVKQFPELSVRLFF